MTTPDSTKIARLVLEYQNRAPEEQASFLEEVCGNDPAFRRELERAIQNAPPPQSGASGVDPEATLDLPEPADAEATIDLPASGSGAVDPDATLDLPDHVDSEATLDFEEDSAAKASSGASASADKKKVDSLPEQIGDFRIIGLLGEGGMGAVYLADQLHPRRRVALKVIKAKIISKDAIKRFEVEGETLAKLSHPAVAQVFAAGIESDAGGSVPFFAMEYVEDAKTITEWADAEELDLRSRLELFANACEALSHAHQRGVIHRDLKPGNVLVNGIGELKVIDFGVAQVEEEQQAELSQPKQIVGTLQYMPPEQVRGEQDIDTSCDVYAFGVVLYQMLVGELPYEIDTTSIANAITSVIEAPTPSLLEVKPGLGRDLDAIIAKALAKERSDRYSSAAELGGDIRRYLDDEPITARSQTTGESIRRFMRKHRTATSAIVIVCLVIIAGLVSVSVFAYRAEVARAEENRQRLVAEEATRRVEQQRERLEKIVEFQSAMIKEVDPSQMGASLRSGILESARNQVESTDLEIEEIEFFLADQEQFLNNFNPTDVAIGLFDAHILKSGLETIPRKFEGDPLTEAAVREIIADSYEILGRYESAEPEYERALEIRNEMLGPTSARTLESASDLGILMMSQARLDAAESLLTKAMSGRKTTLGLTHPETIASIQNLGKLRYQQRDFPSAKKLWEEAYDASLERHGELHPISIQILGNLGTLSTQLGELDVAKELLTRELNLNERMYGDGAPETMLTMRNLADIALQTQDIPEASRLLEESLAGYRVQLGDRHPDTLSVIYELGLIRMEHQDRLLEGQELLNTAYQAQDELLGEGHPDTFKTLQALAQSYIKASDPQGLAPIAVLAHRSSLKLNGLIHPMTLQWLYIRAVSARDAELFADSEQTLQEIEELCLENREAAAALCNLVPQLYAKLYREWDRVEPGQGYDVKAAQWSAILEGGENPTS
ncbi:MAG: hypothetical protein CBC35_08690 [Planctomycetes bacterium TMED75]|nr:hypothetical protein [Planctomycetaceae bacterium]OUU91837.1 MAG: hypothetical protein CBC35_08690 [Planctomycetes bacterium TMED75]